MVRLALHIVINISFEGEGSIIVPRGYIVCKQVCIKGKSPKPYETSSKGLYDFLLDNKPVTGVGCSSFLLL